MRLLQRRVVGRVHDEPVDVLHASLFPGLYVQLCGWSEVGFPTQPAVVPRVDVVVCVGQGTELRECVGDAIDVAAVLLHLGARLYVGVGDEIG